MPNISVNSFDANGHTLVQRFDAELDGYIWIDESYQDGAEDTPHPWHELPVLFEGITVLQVMEYLRRLDDERHARFKQMTFGYRYDNPTAFLISDYVQKIDTVHTVDFSRIEQQVYDLLATKSSRNP